MTIKDILGKVPFSAELYDAIIQRRPRTRYNLEQLAAHIPAAAGQVRPFAEKAPKGRKILLFATLHYWVEQAAMIGLTLRGLGHDVTVAYLPYFDWRKEINAFDLRRQDAYTRRVLAPAGDLLKTVSLLDVKSSAALPAGLEEAVRQVSIYDAQYTLQIEDVDTDSALYRLRLERNRQAARAALSLLQAEKPDVVLVPNGTVTELGVVYRVARHLGLHTTTYEFNDQREQIWLAHNDEVMHQNTDNLWQAKGGHPLTANERKMIEELESARMGAKAFGKSVRQWQDVATVGGGKLRSDLGLDERPVVLLATNVLGDSLTLGRDVFAASMADWITQTVRFFADRPTVQVVIRVHPGERLAHGPSMAEVVRAALPSIPEHTHIIGPLEKVNTYDLMEFAALGLVYTTTTGMEMAMNGIPVVVGGQTHYRGRGFTFDPSSWDEYYAILEKNLAEPKRLTQTQVETAWEYAYRFFYEYPQPFPWRLMHFWKDVDIWPVSRVLSDEGRAEFGKTFDYLAGETIIW